MSDIIFVVDIDGTICDSRERMKEIIDKYGGEENWTDETIEEFLQGDKLMSDKIMPGANKLFHLAKKCNAKVMFLTGRNERARGLTLDWLWNNFRINGPLYMRPIGRKNGTTAECKEDIFLETIFTFNKDATFIFFEDDGATAQRYAKYGLVLKSPECWNCVL